MNTTIDHTAGNTMPHKGVNGRNGAQNDRIEIHEFTVLRTGPEPAAPSPAQPLSLPAPPFPRDPEKLGDVEPDPKLLPKNGNPYRSSVTLPMIRRALRGWLYPYVGSLVKPGEFHPIISYLFTEWKCNLDCHYCWAFDNRAKGMTEDVARRSIDWLHATGCRVLALMGGEVLLRPDFAHKVADYAVQKGFWVYVPTNGRLMRPEVIDKLADAGIATFNLAVDSVEHRKELPKSLNPIRSYFEYLIKKQYVYNYSVFFNINITRINLEDVRLLTEIAHDAGIATDYHINETPMLDAPHFKQQGWQQHVHHEGGLASGRRDGRLADREKPFGIQNGELRPPAGGDEGVHARQDSGLELPSRTEFAHYPHRWYPGSLLPDVQRLPRLGNGRPSLFREAAACPCESRMPTALFFHAEPQPGLLLQRLSRDPLGAEAGGTWIQGD